VTETIDLGEQKNCTEMRNGEKSACLQRQWKSKRKKINCEGELKKMKEWKMKNEPWIVMAKKKKK